MVNLETLAVLHITRGSYEGNDEIIYSVDTDYIPGKDFPKVFDEKVRVILDMIIDDAKENDHLLRTRLFSTGSYSGPFRDSIVEAIKEAEIQKREREEVDRGSRFNRQGNSQKDMNFDPFFYVGLTLGMGAGYFSGITYGTFIGAAAGAVIGIGAYTIREIKIARSTKIIDAMFPLSNRAEDYQRMLDVFEVRR